MKKGVYILGTALLLASCGEATTENIGDTAGDVVEKMEETVETEEIKTEFGAVTVDKTKAISTSELLANFDGKTEMESTFKAEISEVCSKMGCWISVENPTDADENIMVIFKDHFTIPVDTKLGTTAFLHGVAKQDTVSVERQRHLLEDGGMTAEEAEKEVTEPKITMNFIADGISIATGE